MQPPAGGRRGAGRGTGAETPHDRRGRRRGRPCHSERCAAGQLARAPLRSTWTASRRTPARRARSAAQTHAGRRCSDATREVLVSGDSQHLVGSARRIEAAGTHHARGHRTLALRADAAGIGRGRSGVRGHAPKSLTQTQRLGRRAERSPNRARQLARWGPASIDKRHDHDDPTRLSQERQPGARQPRLRARVHRAHGRRPRRRRQKVLVAIFQRGAVDGLNMIVPFGEQGRTTRRGPSIAIPRPKRDRRRDRSRRLLRPASAHGAARAAVQARRARDRPRLRIARRDALALRRAGLHGKRHARREEHARRLDEPLSARARSTRKRVRSAPSRSRRSCRARCRAPRRRWPSATLNQFGVRAGNQTEMMSTSTFEAHTRRRRRRAPALDREGSVRRGQDAARTRIPTATRRPTAPSIRDRRSATRCVRSRN